MKKIKFAAIVLLGLLFFISYQKDRAATLFSSLKFQADKAPVNNTEEDLITRMGPVVFLYSDQLP